MLLGLRARTDIEAIHEHIAQDAPLAASRWVEGVFAAVASLANFPHRCPRAPEEDILCVGLRKLVHGNYRILFTIDEGRRWVKVAHVRHGARRPLTLDELADEESGE